VYLFCCHRNRRWSMHLNGHLSAVYFGGVGVRHTRHAVAAGLLADLAGIVAAIAICYLFFG